MRNDDQAVELHEDWPRVLEWAEAQGLANLKERIDTKRWLQQESATTLTVCLAGAGGSLAYAAPLFGADGLSAETRLAWGSMALCFWLAAVSVALIWFCLRARPMPMLHSEAGLLAQPGFSLMALRREELRNLQERAVRARQEVERAAKALNSLRLAAAAGPLVFALGAWQLRNLVLIVAAAG